MSIGRNIVKQALPGTIGTLYTVPVAKRLEIRSITAVNRDDSSDGDWFLYLVDSGDTADTSNVLVPGTSQWDVPMGENIDYETWKVLEAGGTIQGYSTGSITIHIDGALVDA